MPVVAKRLSRLGERLPAILRLAFIAMAAGGLIGSIVWQPTKRNIEVLAGLVFLGIVLIADPFKALLFTLVVTPFPAYTSVGATTTLLIFALVGLMVIKSRQLHLPSPFVSKETDLAIMGWGLMVLLSFYVQPSEAMREARMLLMGFVSAVMLYYVIIYLIRDAERFWTAASVFQVVATLLALLGLYQYYFPHKQILPEFFDFSRHVATMEEIRRGQVRVQGTFAGQELFAEFLAISSVYHFFLWRRARHLFVKGYWLVSQVLVLAALFATATRGALIILVVGYGYLALVGTRVLPRREMLTIAFVALACFYIALAFAGGLVDFMFERIASIGPDDGSMQNRSIVLTQALQAIPDSPFLGHGISIPDGTFRGYVSRNIHNLYVTLAYTIGLPGLGFFIWFMMSLWRKTWSVMRNSKIPLGLREMNLLGNTSLVMFMVDQLKIEYTRQELTMHVSWFWFGMAFAAWRVTYLQLRRGG